MDNFRFFEGAGIGAMAYPAGGNAEACLPVDADGVLDTGGKIPDGFYLVVILPSKAKIMLGQRELLRHHGQYSGHAISQLGNLMGPDFDVRVLNNPMRVKRAGKGVWLPWKGSPRDPSNKVDCWIVGESGHVDLFQVGIVTHDNGTTFHLLGEYRWKGVLYQNSREIVGVPDNPVWGAFGVRKEILENQDFLRLLPPLQKWEGGRPEDLDPPLDHVPGDGHARVQWYSPFTGQTGQGPVTLGNGTKSWVHGADLIVDPDSDGIKRLHRNDLLAFSGIGSFGPEGTKLLCVQRVPER